MNYNTKHKTNYNTIDWNEELSKYHTVKEGLAEVIPPLIEEAGDYGLDERINITENLIDVYIEMTDKTPDASSLYQLGNYVLSEDFKKNDPHKRSRPYSFASPRQEYREKVEPNSFSIGDMNIGVGVSTGFRKSQYEDENGRTKDIRQPIFRYNN